MLPYPTDRRRLLMMVRSFVSDFADYVGTRWHGLQYPSDPDHPEHQLEQFLEHLAVSAADDDDGVNEMLGEHESEAEIIESLQAHLDDLLRHASRNGGPVSAN